MYGVHENNSFITVTKSCRLLCQFVIEVETNDGPWAGVAALKLHCSLLECKVG